MKRHINTLLICLLTLLIGASCNHNKNKNENEDPYFSPENITKTFAGYLYTGHFEEAKNYATPESTPIINFYQQAFPAENFAGCDHIDIDDMTVTTMTDSTAICKCTLTLCNGKKSKSVTKVVKRDGKWYVTLREGENEKKAEAQEQIKKFQN